MEDAPAIPFARFGTLMVVSGPSGAGKSTVCGQLLRDTDELRFSVSCTTRGPRQGERDGVDYRFMSAPEFEELVRADAFLEHAEVHGNFYGTLRSEVEDHIRDGSDVLLDIDVQGARRLRRGLGRSFLSRCAVFVFFAPPGFEELSRRLRSRAADTEEVIQRRLHNAKAELAAWREYDYLVVNDDASATAERLRMILTASHYATVRMTDAASAEREGAIDDGNQ